MEDLFAGLRPERETITDGMVLLPAFADTTALYSDIHKLTAKAPFRHMVTPGGFSMSVAMSNCGTYGWTTDRQGYRYTREDPLSDEPWPIMPSSFRELAKTAAEKAGFGGFDPDACLINRYAPGARLTPHQDKNERDMVWPIVSVSIGVPAVFQVYGEDRRGSPELIKLFDGDVLVWGGPARLYYHGVKKLENAQHPLTGHFRYNLTFRRAG